MKSNRRFRLTKRVGAAMVMALVFALPTMGQGKKSISVLGDSYSTFRGYVEPDTNYVWYPHEQKKNDVVSPDQLWWHILIREHGFKLCQNNSFSGSTICNTGYNRDDYSDRSFITRYKRLGRPDVILIFGATNDSWAKSPIGDYKYEGWKRSDLYRFRPALAYLLHHTLLYYPGTDIYFILNSDLSSDITESAKEICQHYSVACIALHDIEKQAGHPSQAGMRAIADQVAEVIAGK